MLQAGRDMAGGAPRWGVRVGEDGIFFHTGSVERNGCFWSHLMAGDPGDQGGTLSDPHQLMDHLRRPRRIPRLTMKTNLNVRVPGPYHEPAKSFGDLCYILLQKNPYTFSYSTRSTGWPQSKRYLGPRNPSRFIPPAPPRHRPPPRRRHQRRRLRHQPPPPQATLVGGPSTIAALCWPSSGQAEVTGVESGPRLHLVGAARPRRRPCPLRHLWIWA
jgi:hypothetical protein